jgi:hypothetical protein
MRGAALPLLLLVAACGHQRSRAELEDRIAELEDENDTLKQQLGEAQDQLDKRPAKAVHAVPAARRVKRVAADINPDRPAHAARLYREAHGTFPSNPHKTANEAQNAATQALIAAADARKALAQR